MKILRYGLYGFAVLALLGAAAIAYLAATFDPRDYHTRIVRLVAEKTGRTLEIRGETALSFWPDVAVRLGALTLSEREGSERFASIESARLTVKLRPLLAREFLADEVVIVGAQVNIVRDEDGRLNIDDLIKGEGGVPAFDIGRFALERSVIVYRDAASAKRYDLTQVDLLTGRVANTVATPVTLAFNVRDGEATFQLGVALKGRLTFDLQQQRYGLQQASLHVKGRASGADDLAVTAAGNISTDLRLSETSATQLSASISCTVREEIIHARIEAPRLRVAEKSEAEGLTVVLDATGPAGVTSVRLATDRLTHDAHAIVSDSVALDIELKRGELAFRAAIAAPMDASLSSRTVLLKELKADFIVSGAQLPGKKLSGAMRGSASLDLAKEGVQVKLAGKVAESQVKAQLTAAGLAAPVYTFAIDVDQIDLDRYGSASTSAPATRRGGPATALDLSPLAALPASGTLQIGVLKAANMKASNVRLVLK